MAMRTESEECKAEGYRKKPAPSTSFWNFSIIGQLQTLTGAQNSFEQLRRGQRRALESLQTSASANCKGHCDGDLFRSPFGDAAQSALSEGELIAHLRIAKMASRPLKVEESKTLHGRRLSFVSTANARSEQNPRIAHSRPSFLAIMTQAILILSCSLLSTGS